MPKQETKQTKPKVNLRANPMMTLDLGTRFFLVADKKTIGKLTFVYTLACHGEYGRYEQVATTEIATFDNEHKADIYYQTILAAIEYEKSAALYQIVVDYNQGLIHNFNVAMQKEK